MTKTVFLVASFLSFIAAGHSAATCYYPDGTIEPTHVPCNQTITGSSACCNNLDSCTLTGLCRGASGWDYRGSCTDSTWSSVNCGVREWPQCVTDPSTDELYDNYTPIWSCSPEGTGGVDYCCGYSNGSSCCDDSFVLGVTGIAFQPGFDAFVQNLTDSATNTSSSTSAQTSSPVPVASAVNDNGDIGTKVGLGVGIPLGILVAGILGFLFWRESRKTRGIQPLAQSSPSHSPMVQNAAVAEFNGNHHDQIPVGNGFNKSYHDQTAIGTPVSYEPNVQKLGYSQPAPVYEAPQNDVHELRG